MSIRRTGELVSYSVTLTGSGSLQQLAEAVADWQGLSPQEPTLQCPVITTGVVSDPLHLPTSPCFVVAGTEKVERITVIRGGESQEQFELESLVTSLIGWLADAGWQAVMYAITFSQGVVNKYSRD